MIYREEGGIRVGAEFEVTVARGCEAYVGWHLSEEN